MPSSIQHHFPNYLGLSVSKLYCLFWHQELYLHWLSSYSGGWCQHEGQVGTQHINMQQEGCGLKNSSYWIKGHQRKVNLRMDEGRASMKSSLCPQFQQKSSEELPNLSDKERSCHRLILQMEKLRHAGGNDLQRGHAAAE